MSAKGARHADHHTSAAPDQPPGRARRRARLVALSLVGALVASATGVVALTLAVVSAYAGQWVEVSCVNPNQSPAPSQGWSGFTAGAPGYGSNNSTNCAPGTPMLAILSTAAPASTGTSENLQYTPPAGSTLVGGSVNVAMSAYGTGTGASGTAVAYTPAFAYDGSDVFFQCAFALPACANGTQDFAGTLNLPVNRGGNFYLSAGCGGNPGAVCNAGGSNGAWSLVRLQWANFLLSSPANPTGSGFGGRLLAPNAHATSDITFTASDPDGPGVYRVTAQIDGATVYSATTDTNGGACAPVGNSGGALMFDFSQPCRQSESVDLPIDTSALPDGPHALRITVTDAALNSSVVYDSTITTQNASGTLGATPGPGTPVARGPGAANGTPASAGATLRLGARAVISRAFGHRAFTLAGRLLNAQGLPITGATLDVLEQPIAAGSPETVIAHATTGGDGSFTVPVPPGPSRLVAVAYRAFANDPGYATRGQLRENVAAGVRLHVTPRHAGTTGTIVLSGRVLGPVPPQGVVVELLVHYLGRWEPFRAPRTNRSGRFRSVYQFQGATGRFPFRAQVRGGQAGYPFALGESRSVNVTTG